MSTESELAAKHRAYQDRARFIHRINEVDGELQRESYVYWTTEGAIELWRTPSSYSWDGNGYIGGVEVHSTIGREMQTHVDGCPWVRGGKCYPDGSSMAFDRYAHDFDSPNYIKVELMNWHADHFGSLGAQS